MIIKRSKFFLYIEMQSLAKGYEKARIFAEVRAAGQSEGLARQCLPGEVCEQMPRGSESLIFYLSL